MRILLIFTFLNLVASTSFAVDGGTEADPRSRIATTAISLGDLNTGTLSRSFCSGVIVSNQTIVTAAHCLDGRDPAKTAVMFGFNGQTTTVMRIGTKIDIPTQYHYYGDNLPQAKQNYDIAVMRFEGGLPDGFTPATLASDDLAADTVGDTVSIGGFGLPNTGILQTCTTTMENPFWSENEFELNSSTTCTPDGGDSGGPDYVDNGSTIVLYGIHNWGWHDANGNPNMSVEAKIYYYAGWINWLSQ